MKVYLVTCSKSRFILDISVPLWKRFGFNVEIIDVKNDPVEKWTHNVLKRLKTKDKYAIFTLDDFLIEGFNEEVFSNCFTYMKSLIGNNVVRYELGGEFYKKKKYHILHSEKNYNIIGIEKGPYKLSLQPSIWDMEYLKDKLTIKGSPWDFETKISNQTDSDKRIVIGTTNIYALKYRGSSALSRKWKGINYGGLTKNQIEKIKNGNNIHS